MSRKPDRSAYNLNEFATAAQETGKFSGKFSHRVNMRTLHDQLYYCKEMLSPAVARSELLAQEIFRLFIPGHPVSKLAFNPATGTAHLLSAAVPGFHKLPDRYSRHNTFNARDYRGNGLGSVALLSGYLQEVDLKNNNVGLNEHGQVIKIDGDWCFAGIRHAESFPIRSCPVTVDFITALPRPIGFGAYNWLEYRKENVAYAQSDLVSSDLNQSPAFQQEILETIHKILLTPTLFFECMVDACMPADGSRHIEFLVSRQKALFQQSLLLPNFMDYLASGKAREVEARHFVALRDFTMNRDQRVIPRDELGGFEAAYEDTKGLLNQHMLLQTITEEPEGGGEQAVPRADAEGEHGEQVAPDADVEGEHGEQVVPADADVEGEYGEQVVPADADVEGEYGEQVVPEADVEGEYGEQLVLDVDGGDGLPDRNQYTAAWSQPGYLDDKKNVVKAIVAIYRAIHDYSPKRCGSRHSGSPKHAACQKAIEAIENKASMLGHDNDSDIGLYKTLHNILFKPFFDRDIEHKVGVFKAPSRFLHILQNFSTSVGDPLYPTYDSKLHDILASKHAKLRNQRQQENIGQEGPPQAQGGGGGEPPRRGEAK